MMEMQTCEKNMKHINYMLKHNRKSNTKHDINLLWAHVISIVYTNNARNQTI